jgi:biotin operon repressor
VPPPKPKVRDEQRAAAGPPPPAVEDPTEGILAHLRSAEGRRVSRKELAATLGVTVESRPFRRALRTLRDRGAIDARLGSGYVLAQNATDPAVSADE